jgi:PAP2 superfamily
MSHDGQEARFGMDRLATLPESKPYNRLPRTLPTVRLKDRLGRTALPWPWVNDLVSALRENFSILLIVTVYMIEGLLIESSLGLNGMMRIQFNYYLLNVFAIFFTAGFFMIQFIVRIPGFARGKDDLRTAGREIRERYLTVERLAGFLIVYCSIPLFMSTFRSFKETITRIQPFGWDERWMELDYYLHFGNHPWALLQPLLGRPIITRALDLFYMAWFPLLAGFVFWMAWSHRRILRLRFFISLGLLWIVVGTIAATLLSSAGPCYYSYVTDSNNPFLPLMNYLHSVHRDNALWAVRNQQGLWNAHLNSIYMPLGGISAMPSMHVSVAVLFALVGFEVNRWFGRILIAFAIINMIGSVHLGWHYAIDGYLGAALAWMIWKATPEFFGFPKLDYIESRSPK